MKRTSNLAFNREFPAKSGRSGLPKHCPISLRRDRSNRFDEDAVGVYTTGDSEVLGWLFKKDSNRADVLKKLDAGGALDGHIEAAPPGSKVRFVVVFWL